MDQCQKPSKYGHSSRQNSKLTRDDFDDDISVDLSNIDSKLYLGNITAAKDLETIHKYEITHILTLDTCPLPRSITELPNLNVKFVHITDQPKEDLLTRLDETNKFIEEAVENGTILVHCYFGMSRSAAVVIAHIMKKYELSYEEALARVKEKRRVVLPNVGFAYQLKLFEEMRFKIDKSNSKYKLFRLTLAADTIKKTKVLPPCFMDLIKSDPGLNTVNPEPKVYRCRKCRRIVASESNVLVHAEQNKIFWNGKSKTEPEEADASEKELCSKTYFIEPLAWMKNVAQTVQGKLHCPNCSAKLGSYSWVMGCQCPCGTKVSPAFYLVPSKVEWSNAVQNIQMTV